VADAKRLLEEIPNKVKDILGILVDVNLHTSQQDSPTYLVAHLYFLQRTFQY